MEHISLTPIEIKQQLEKYPNWRLENGRMMQDFTFPNFPAAFAFMTEVALVAQKINHHPIFYNDFKKVRLELWSFDAGSVTWDDIKLAEAIEQIPSK